MATRIRNRASRPVTSMLNAIRRWDGATAIEALREVGGDWTPKVSTIHLPDGSQITGHQAIQNPENGSVLGLTSDGYMGLPNSLLADGIERFSDALGMKYKMSHASVIHSGAVVKLEAILGDQLDIGIPGESVYRTVSAFQGHGGNLPFSVAVQTKRLVCSNGMMVAIPGLSTSFSVRHTLNGLAKVEWNFHLIQSSFADATQKVEDGFRILAQKKSDMASFRRFYRTYVEQRLGQTGPKADATIESLEVIHFAPRNEIGGDTLWRGFNVLQEFEQYHGFRSDDAMEVGNLAGPAAKAKTLAYQFALDYAIAS
jgi:hypothetical protein